MQRCSRHDVRGATLLVLCCVATLALAHAAAVDARSARDAVRSVGDQRVELHTADGAGRLALFASRPLQGGAAQDDVDRVVILVHGLHRNAAHAFATEQAAARRAPQSSAHTLLIAPQFLDVGDARAHELPAATLRWRGASWEAGAAAVAPAPIGSYEALDALLALLADRTRFPHLSEVVVAGHSGGAQLVQRYAVVGEGSARLVAEGVHLRYVVANPSSYLYFDRDRPQEGGGFAPPAPPVACKAFNRWKYGFEDAPAYARRLSADAYERRFVGRDVVYLLGGADNDPNHPELDKSCAAEAQGSNRWARGHAWVAYLGARHPGLKFIEHDVPGVGHDERRMFESACGVAALFDDAQSRSACEGASADR